MITIESRNADLISKDQTKKNKNKNKKNKQKQKNTRRFVWLAFVVVALLDLHYLTTDFNRPLTDLKICKRSNEIFLLKVSSQITTNTRSIKFCH